jgi:chemotaxis protein histidine kinase CheA
MTSFMTLITISTSIKGISYTNVVAIAHRDNYTQAYDVDMSHYNKNNNELNYNLNCGGSDEDSVTCSSYIGGDSNELKTSLKCKQSNRTTRVDTLKYVKNMVAYDYEAEVFRMKHGISYMRAIRRDERLLNDTAEQLKFRRQCDTKFANALKNSLKCYSMQPIIDSMIEYRDVTKKYYDRIKNSEKYSADEKKLAKNELKSLVNKTKSMMHDFETTANNVCKNKESRSKNERNEAAIIDWSHSQPDSVVFRPNGTLYWCDGKRDLTTDESKTYKMYLTHKKYKKRSETLVHYKLVNLLLDLEVKYGIKPSGYIFKSWGELSIFSEELPEKYQVVSPKRMAAYDAMNQRKYDKLVIKTENAIKKVELMEANKRKAARAAKNKKSVEKSKNTTKNTAKATIADNDTKPEKISKKLKLTGDVDIKSKKVSKKSKDTSNENNLAAMIFDKVRIIKEKSSNTKTSSKSSKSADSKSSKSSKSADSKSADSKSASSTSSKSADSKSASSTSSKSADSKSASSTSSKSADSKSAKSSKSADSKPASSTSSKSADSKSASSTSSKSADSKSADSKSTSSTASTASKSTSSSSGGGKSSSGGGKSSSGGGKSSSGGGKSGGKSR